MEKISISDIDFEHKKYGFHFTNTKNEESFEKTGIEARIGTNSSGELGREAIEKAFFSYEVNGCLKTFNRLIHIPHEGGMSALMDLEHYKYLPEMCTGRIPENIRSKIDRELEDYYKLEEDLSKSNLTNEEKKDRLFDSRKKLEETLSQAKTYLKENNLNDISYTEGFEIVNNMMQDTMYLMFEVAPNEYENEITQDDVDKINSLKEQDSDLNAIYCEVSRLDELMDKNIDKSLRSEYAEQRKECSIKIRDRLFEEIKKIRGEKINSGEFDLYDFNEDHCSFECQDNNNVHTQIERNPETGKLIGKSIKSDALRILSSKDGKIDGTSIIRDIFKYRNSSERYALLNKRAVDTPMIEMYLEYIQMPENIRVENADSINEEIEIFEKYNKAILNRERKQRLLPTDSEKENPYYNENGIGKIVELIRKKSKEYVQTEETEYKIGNDCIEGAKNIADTRIARDVIDTAQIIKNGMRDKSIEEKDNSKRGVEFE